MRLKLRVVILVRDQQIVEGRIRSIAESLVRQQDAIRPIIVFSNEPPQMKPLSAILNRVRSIATIVLVVALARRAANTCFSFFIKVASLPRKIPSLLPRQSSRIDLFSVTSYVRFTKHSFSSSLTQLHLCNNHSHYINLSFEHHNTKQQKYRQHEVLQQPRPLWPRCPRLCRSPGIIRFQLRCSCHVSFFSAGPICYFDCPSFAHSNLHQGL